MITRKGKLTILGLSLLMALVMCVLYVGVCFQDAKALDATKTQTTELQAWVEVAQNAVKESSEFDCTEHLIDAIIIRTCLSSTTAHTGTEVQVWVSGSTADDDWGVLTSYVCCVGTATKSDFADTEAAAQTVLSITNPATGNLYAHDGKWVFLEDTAAVANSEVVYQVASTDDDGDTITVLDGITHAKDTDDDVYTVDGDTASAVSNQVIHLPGWVNKAKVVWNNTYDADGSTVHVQARGLAMTDIE